MKYSFEKNNNDSTADSGLFTPADTLRKVINAAEHSFRANASSLLISTALRFKLVKNVIHVTKKTTTQLSHGLLEGKCHLVPYKVALNLYANIRLYHHIKGLNVSTAAASQRKTANEKFLLFVTYNIMV